MRVSQPQFRDEGEMVARELAVTGESHDSNSIHSHVAPTEDPVNARFVGPHSFEVVECADATLWIFDEVHLLSHTYRRGSFHNCMEVIREIHDECRCGMVLCFTILDEVRAASQKELQQVWRRGVHKVFLPSMPTRLDLTAICEHNGLDFPAPETRVQIHFRDAAGRRQTIEERPYEIIRLVAKTEALLAFTERLRYGRKLAGRAGEKLGWKHFCDAHLRIAKQAEPEPEW